MICFRCLRIIFFVIVVSIAQYMALVFYNQSSWIIPIGQYVGLDVFVRRTLLTCCRYYEGFAIIAIFLLYVELATPDPHSRDAFYDDLELRWPNGRKRGDQGSLAWFRVSAIYISFTRRRTEE